MTAVDIDALLAAAGTVPEPSADNLLAWDGANRTDLEAWLRYRDWRDDAGHRHLCVKCTRVFIRDRSKGQRCPDCRRKFKRTCAGCGEQFSATHYMLRRCPPCRAERLKRPRGQLEQERRPCGRCGESFTPRSWNAKYCFECQRGRTGLAGGAPHEA